jgi:hypothetical protein
MTPSFNPRAIAITASTIDASGVTAVMPGTNERSIFSVSIGKRLT